MHEREGDPNDGIEQARYEDKAFPADTVDFALSRTAAAAFDAVAKRPGGKKTNWQQVARRRHSCLPR